jgi:hypothetical protein
MPGATLSQDGEVDGGGWSWARAASAIQRDLLLLLLLLVLLQAVRFALVAVFHRQLGTQAGLGQFLMCALAGLRFDARIALLAALPSLLLSVAQVRWRLPRAGPRVRATTAVAFLAATLLTAGADLAFFSEFGCQFDDRTLGALYDDLGAVLLTLWREHHVVWLGLGFCALVVTGGWLAVRIFARWGVDPRRLARWPWQARVAATIAVALVLAVGARGSLGWRPVQRKDVAVTGDVLLDRLVLNPWKALHYAVEDHLLLLNAGDVRHWLPDGDVRAAAERAAGVAPGDLAPGTDLDACLQRRAVGTAAPPSTIVLAIMESYSAWPLAPRYRQLGLAEEVASLMERGTGTVRFLSAGNGTMSSVNALLAGLQEVGINLNYRPAARKAFPTALAAIFARLGYRTRFFYSGYASWQRIGDFARDQGFHEVACGADVGGNFLNGKEWGVDDDRLFAHAAAVIAAGRAAGPSLNVILTVSNHPPYEIDVAAKGFSLTRPPQALSDNFDGSLDLRVLGHFWFADRCLGDFVRGLEREDPGLLVAVTGDHTQHRFINGRPTAAERLLVPCVLYGPRVLAGRRLPPDCAGDHLDLIPTLVERAAPAGFAYPSLGRDLFAPDRVQRGLGRAAAVLPQAVVHWDRGREECDAAGLGSEARRSLAAAWADRCALSWWRVMRGPVLPAASPSPPAAPMPPAAPLPR